MAEYRLTEAPHETRFGNVLVTMLDGDVAWKLECPGCGKWAWIDEDQLHGRVSVDHTDTGCTYHETHDFAAEMDRLGARDARAALRRLRGET